MSGYLLLRDNKQTGPYSKDEIIAKGFKPYDLIWAEGKSAGWRYPGELPEFAAFAPMVEEQPFDRFFKKPAATTTTAFNKTTSAPAAAAQVEHKTTVPVEDKIEEEAPEAIAESFVMQPAAKIINLPPRKIFVTLPGSTAAPVTTKAQPVVNRTIKPEDDKYMPAPAAAIPDRVVPEEKEIKPQPVSTASSAPSYSSYQPGAQFIQDRLQSREHEEKLYIPAASRKTSFRALFIGSVAACLLLGGVIIGLLISNSKQSSGQEQLNSLVKQIQQREAAKKQQPEEQQSAPTVPVQQAVLSQPEENLPSKPGDQKADDNNIAKSVVNKEPVADEKINQAKTTESITTDVKKNKNQETKLPEADKAVIDTRTDQKSESARQNIYQLVSLAGSNYKTGVLGGISNLELTVSNNSLYPIDQVEVLVSYMNIENKIVKKETVIINDVAAGEQKTIPVPKSKRGVSVTYSITKINSRALGLAHSGL